MCPHSPIGVRTIHPTARPLLSESMPVPVAQEESLAAEKENAALLLTKADRCDAEHQLLSDTLACARACFCHA